MFSKDNKLYMLIVVLSYENTSYYLPGTKKDLKNLIKFCENNRIEYSTLLNDEINSDSLKKKLINFNPDIVWFSGHGYLNDNNLNELILTKDLKTNFFRLVNYGKIADYEMLEIIENYINNSRKDKILLIYDLCNSATLLNLEYYFKNLTFFEKSNDKERQLKNDNKIILSISAATDREKTYESEEGGYLTLILLNLFENYKFVSLNLLNSVIPSDNVKDYNCIISVNKIINPFEILFEI